jgi:glucose-1-phosphate thymidylyltransferase
VQSIEERQGLMIACLEEIAYRMGYIAADQVKRLAEIIGGGYGRYLLDILDQQLD